MYRLENPIYMPKHDRFAASPTSRQSEPFKPSAYSSNDTVDLRELSTRHWLYRCRFTARLQWQASELASVKASLKRRRGQRDMGIERRVQFERLRLA